MTDGERTRNDEERAKNDGNGARDGEGSRVATIRTTHADAGLVAASLAPDDTDSIDARVDGDAVACTVARPTTGGLRSTVDDYVVNLRIADRVIDRARAYRGAEGARTDAEPTAETDTAETEKTKTDATETGATDADATDTNAADINDDTNTNT